MGYEIVEQLGWRSPDAVIIPVASGSVDQDEEGLGELHTVGLLDQALHTAIPEPRRTAVHRSGVRSKKALTTSVR